LQEQNIKYDLMQYGISENGKVIKKERCVSVRDISKVARARFLDCYIEINDRQIALEFDDSNHNEKRFKDDLLREQEILIKKPKLEIYRIKEKYVNKNRNQVIEDLINIIQDKSSKTNFNYLNYIKLQKII
jgi:very-short-patch-repair endonuclease